MITEPVAIVLMSLAVAAVVAVIVMNIWATRKSRNGTKR